MDQILSVNIPAPTISSSWDIAAPVDVQAVEPVWADASPAAQLALATSAVALADLTVDGAGPQSLAETAQSISLPVAQPTTAAAESLLSQDFDPRAIIDSLLIGTFN